MKAYEGVDVWIHIFLTSALVGGEWSASRSCRFTPGERAPFTHWIEGWVSTRARLDDVEKRKFLTLPGLELRHLGRPARSQSLYRITLFRLEKMWESRRLTTLKAVGMYPINTLAKFNWSYALFWHIYCCVPPADAGQHLQIGNENLLSTETLGRLDIREVAGSNICNIGAGPAILTDGFRGFFSLSK
jgi:hypothetical protein